MCLRLLILTETIFLGILSTVEAGTGPWCRKCVNSTDPQQNPLHIGLVLVAFLTLDLKSFDMKNFASNIQTISTDSYYNIQ